ncbi:hypothetical protein KBY96_12155 [Cyanobium sp. ATX 6A2]|uniref:hypothetical protein n=1 Tax=Cyanobium sp. ATX 6A2 TaxID=2823700 RepID=UPI0020CCCB25|nr:hypothetical protein [Cyanobium sp. ATX 6A2]MCP9888674.1 hypothetical protein [Cyanobium sp. ATX 6A2]
MPAFTYERDLDHPVAPAVEEAIRGAVEPLLNSQGLESIRVIPGLDHDGDPVLYVELQFRLVQPGVDPRVLSQAGPALRRALWAIGERRFPHLRYDFHPDQQVLSTPRPVSWPSCMNAGPGRLTSDVP